MSHSTTVGQHKKTHIDIIRKREKDSVTFKSFDSVEIRPNRPRVSRGATVTEPGARPAQKIYSGISHTCNTPIERAYVRIFDQAYYLVTSVARNQMRALSCRRSGIVSHHVKTCGIQGR